MNNSFLEIGNRILDAETILLFPHLHVDGDAMGSCSALCLALRNLGKKSYVLVSEDIPANLDFLEYDFVVKDSEIFDEYDLAIMIDCGGLNRIPGREDVFNRAATKAIIDHHSVSASEINFDYGVIEPESAATAELIYLLIKEMGWNIDKQIASCIWAGIATDSGNFQHSNTSSRTHQIASELHKVDGFSCKEISNLIYSRNSFNAIRLESMVISNAHLYDNGRIIISRVTQQMLEETGCRMDETDGFIQKLMSVNGVVLGCLLKGYVEDQTRCSLRSKSEGNVARVAEKFDGGGHIKAAGCTIKACIDDTERQISEAMIKELELSC